MTIEQAKSEIMQIYGALSPNKQIAIDTLVKMEPCEDAISRDELLKAIDTWDKFGCDADTKLVRYQDHYVPYIHYDDVIKCIKGIPPVNPQEPKTGHWTHDGSHWKNRFICSECGYKLFDEPTNYCPNCGCRIVEPQESEGINDED